MLLAYQDREGGRNGSPFAPVAGGPDAPEGIRAGPRNGSPAPPNKTRNTTGPAAPMLSECSRCCQPIGNGSPQGKRERGKEKSRSRLYSRSKERNERKAATSPQAHKKRVPPPIARSRQIFPLITNSRQKISKKSPWGGFEKIFGKIFRGNVSGAKKNPSRFSTEGALL